MIPCANTNSTFQTGRSPCRVVRSLVSPKAADPESGKERSIRGPAQSDDLGPAAGRREPIQLTLLTTLFLLAACFLNLGGYPLISMEGMVVDGASRMAATSQWAVPHVYGELYTYKPALAYWLSALPQQLVREPSEWWLRLPFAGCGVLLGLVLLISIGRYLGARAGFYVAAATTGSALFVEKIRIGEFDGPLTCSVGLAVLAAVLALCRDRVQVVPWLASYGALVIGFLTKGMPAIMAFAPGLLCAALLLGRWRRLLGLPHLAGVGLFAVIVTAYFGWAVDQEGWHVFDHAREEAGWRAIGWSWSLLARTLIKPALIFAAFLPWSAVLVPAPALFRSMDARTRRVALAALGFLIGGALAFCAVPTHKMRYYLPLGPAAGLLCGVLASRLSALPARGSFVIGVRVMTTLVSVAALLISFTRDVGQPWLLAVLLVVITVAWWRPGAPLLTTGSQLVVCSLLFALVAAYVFVPSRAARRDVRGVAGRFAAQIDVHEPVWTLGPADLAGKHASLFYYLGRRVSTFSSARLPPAGAAIIFAESQRSLLPSSLQFEIVDAIKHDYFRYRLARAL